MFGKIILIAALTLIAWAFVARASQGAGPTLRYTVEPGETVVIAGALGVPPSSELERKIANLFTPYHDLVDQGYAYRYYAEPPPTPVIEADAAGGL